MELVDYILASGNLSELSDHRPLNLNLKYVKQKENYLCVKNNLLPRPMRFQINNIETYKNELTNRMNADNIFPFMSNLDDYNTKAELDHIAKSISEICVQTESKK